MSPLPRTGLARRAAVLGLGIWAGLAALGGAVSAAEGHALPPAALLFLLGPLSWSLAVALAVSGAVERGEWAGWLSLGYRPLGLAAPLLALGALGGALGLLGAQALGDVPGWTLPAPVPAAAQQWPVGEGWGRPALDGWRRSPSALSGRELRERSSRPPPEGSRSGVDRAERLRRLGWALAWPWASAFGVLFGRRERRGSSRAIAAASASAALGAWLLALSLLVAYSSTTT